MMNAFIFFCFAIFVLSLHIYLIITKVAKPFERSCKSLDFLPPNIVLKHVSTKEKHNSGSLTLAQC